MPNVLGVLASKLTKNQLLHEITKKTTSNSRLSLYFLYSEFVLRANRLPAYKEVLNQATWTAVDGRGLTWSIWSLMGTNPIAVIYAKILDLSLFLEEKSPMWLIWIINTIRVIFFLFLFKLNLILNLIVGFITIAGKHRFIHRTQIETILGRDFVWDLLQLAHDKELKVAVVGGSQEGDEMTKHLIGNLFPKIKLVTWVKPRLSNLINDIPKDTAQIKFLENFFPWIVIKNIIEIIWSKLRPKPTFSAFNQDRDVMENLSADNICEFYPDLYDAKDFLRQQKPDYVLLCLGGGSGKQEFFAQHIKQDLSIDFGLITGLGAAIDYLDGGKEKPPTWVCQMGLEWIFRLIHQPYRRLRILDDIFTLWWWTSLQQFLDYADLRKTVIAQVENENGDVLLVKRRSILPGDVGWSYVQGGVESGEDIAEAAKREVFEEVGLEKENLKAIELQEDFAQEIYPVSFFRTLLFLAKYKGSVASVVKLKYSGKTEPKANWENLEARWISNHRVLDYLSQEKKIYYR
jgi:UDP-N-acetyl-D-mannosaminuronic acid transferase (WecB/TagA/CpsF family)/8-oxo-dGTP pyrophosphatase MutT (NUDIX family)